VTISSTDLKRVRKEPKTFYQKFWRTKKPVPF